MRKVLFLLIALLFIYRPCEAADNNGDELLSLVSLTKETATPGKITSMLGSPSKIEENKKRTWWYFTRGNTTMIISWNKKTSAMEKVWFTSGEEKKGVFDNMLSYKLKSGITDIAQALALLGTPKDMTLKALTQEMHYAYQNNVLRLFFREKKLVDFCLY